MRRARPALVVSLLAVAIAACATQAPVVTNRPVTVENLVGSEWLAEDIEGAGVVDNSHTTLHIAAATFVDGDTGCNKFGGPLELTGGTIAIGPLSTTRRACPPALMDQERRYLVALSRGRTLRLDGDALMLLGEEKQPLVRYARVEPTALPTRP